MKRIKDYMPQSLFGRFLLIIIIPTIISQLVAIYVFYERHWNSVSRHMQFATIGDITMIVSTFEQMPSEQRQLITKQANDSMYLRANFLPGETIQQHKKSLKGYDFFSDELARKIANYDYHLYVIGDASNIGIDIAMDDGVMRIIFPTKRIYNPSTYIFILWLSGTAIILLVIAIVFTKNQVRPIAKLAEAAEKLGLGHDIDSLKPSGASEVRTATEAFLVMKKRVNRQVEARMEMLTGVSHDLKTPLTRMKLQLAMMAPSQTIEELQGDIIEMEKMIQEYLDFAKGKEQGPNAPANISDLLRSIVAGYRRHHQNIELQCQSGVSILLNANGFRRAISNLIDNALRFAKKIEINSTKYDNHVLITVDDNGTGIPPKKRPLAFKPFYRIDASRNLDSGGTGLGLTITRDIIVGFGGDIELLDSPLGGLRVQITLPIQ